MITIKESNKKTESVTEDVKDLQESRPTANEEREFLSVQIHQPKEWQ